MYRGWRAKFYILIMIIACLHCAMLICTLSKNDQTLKWYANMQRVFWIFLPNIIKIDPYNFELYCFKVGSFFEAQCSNSRSHFLVMAVRRWTYQSVSARPSAAAASTVVHCHHNVPVPRRARTGQLSARQGRLQVDAQRGNIVWVWPLWFRQSYSRSALLASFVTICRHLRAVCAFTF